MSAHLTEEQIRLYLSEERGRERRELTRSEADLDRSTVGSDVWFGLLGMVLRHREYLDWFGRAISNPTRDGIASMRAMALEWLLDYNPVSVNLAGAVRMVAKKAAVRRVYSDLDPETVLTWLVEQGKVPYGGRISPQEIAALSTPGEVLEMVSRAHRDEEEQLALDLAFALDGSGQIKPGYLGTLAQTRESALRSE